MGRDNAEESPRENDIEEMLDEVIGPRVDEMPASVLPMIDAYINAAQEQGVAVETIQMLFLMKEYIIEKAKEYLPDEMKTLQKLIDASR